MKCSDRIVTIGLSPAWDVSCLGRGLDWGRHLSIDEQVTRPAGKALNVSSALAWMGQGSIAAGLWGREDYEAMRSAVQSWDGLVRLAMTAAAGRTRHNITVVDTQNRREMHLRLRSELATAASLARLNGALRRTVCQDDVCVFSGAMPAGDFLEPVIALVQGCCDLNARVVIDTHGPVLKGLVDAGLPWLIAPNVEELGELLGARVQDSPAKLVAASRTLLEKVPAVLVSRGRKGVVVVTKKGAWMGSAKTRGKVLQTVGCGDYLLAGFLAGHSRGGSVRNSLATALKVATARAWGWTETRTWSQARKPIEVDVARI